MGGDCYQRAREPKEIYWIEGASHVALYDKEEYTAPAVAKLIDLYEANLATAAVRTALRAGCLDGRESAVDRQCRAVDIRGVVAYQERDRGRDLFWCAGSLRRGAGDNALNPVGMDSHNRGDCRPGRYGVHADTGWSILRRPGLRQRVD